MVRLRGVVHREGGEGTGVKWNVGFVGYLKNEINTHSTHHTHTNARVRRSRGCSECAAASLGQVHATTRLVAKPP
jgi:hypothetical protein